MFSMVWEYFGSYSGLFLVQSIDLPSVFRYAFCLDDLWDVFLSKQNWNPGELLIVEFDTYGMQMNSYVSHIVRLRLRLCFPLAFYLT